MRLPAEAARLNGGPDRVAGVPVRQGPAGLLVAEGSIPNGHVHVDPAQFSEFRQRPDTLIIPHRPRVSGPIDIVRLTDFGGGRGRSDFANLEVDLNLVALADEYGLKVEHIFDGHNDKFATENTGYLTWQALVNKNHRGRTRVGYINTNSRYSPDDNRSWTGKDNGSDLVYGRLDNGAHFFTVNRGRNLSYIKPHIVEAYILDGYRIDQFLSRGPFIEVAFDVLSGSDNFIAGELDIESIPDPRKGAIVATDGTDNLKSNIRVKDILEEPGIATSPYLEVSIDGEEPVIAKNGLVPGLVGIGQGNLVVRGGSGGYRDTDLPAGRNFVEVQAMFADALGIFGHNGVVTDETYVKVNPVKEVTQEVIDQANRNYFLEQKEAQRIERRGRLELAGSRA